MQYRVHYAFAVISTTPALQINRPRQVSLTLPDGRGLADVKDGFWVNAEHKWSLAADSKFWIPPSAIMFVEKIK